MGYMAHHAVLITIPGYVIDGTSAFGATMPDLDRFRESLPESFRQLLVGPIEGAINRDYTVAFLPDHSKEGWSHSDTGDRIRRELMELFSFRYDDGSCPFDVVEVRFGGDDPNHAYVHPPTFEDAE